MKRQVYNKMHYHGKRSNLGLYVTANKQLDLQIFIEATIKALL